MTGSAIRIKHLEAENARLRELLREGYDIFMGWDCELIEPEHLGKDDYADRWAHAARAALEGGEHE